MITVPNVKTPDNGLTLCRGYWMAAYKEDSKRRWKSMSTGDIKTARRRRNKFYAELLAAGAEVSKPRGWPPGDPNEFRTSIRYRKPWTLWNAGTMVGSYDTEEEALAAEKASHGIASKRRR
jgi:hypothetical protein